jgi:RimJ/RimL family protein N-acetyltransferase
VEPFLPLRTERLRLRAFVPSDAAAFAAYRSVPAVARYQSWDAPYSVGAAQRLVDEMAGRTGPVPGEWLQIALEHDGALAGDVAVGLGVDGRIATIGYTLAPEAQGRGLASEAVGAVVERLFGHVGVHRVEASLDPRNLASARLVESLGFELEGVAVAAVWTGSDGWTDDARYGLTEEQHAAWSTRPRTRPADVELVAITPDSVRAVLALRTHPHQRRFVGPMANSFAVALFPPVEGGAPLVPWMRAIEADAELVGFVMLAARTGHHPEPYLWRLLVDRRHQRRGIGDRVLARLAEHLRAAGDTTLLVSWVPGPGGPEPFYLARGFVPTGVVDDGEIEGRLTL